MIESSLTLGDSQFTAGLQRADAAVARFRSSLLNIGSALLALASVEKVIEGIRGSLDFAGQMNDLSQQTGSSAGEMAVLGQAIKNAGGGFESAGTFATKFKKALSGLNEDGGSTAVALARLKLNADSLRSMPLIAQVEALQKAFQGIENPEDRIKIAMDLLGKSGAQNIPFLIDPNALGEARTQIGGLAPLLDRNVAAFDKLGDALNAVTVKSTQFFAGLAAGLGGDMNKFADRLNNLDLTGLGVKLGEAARNIGNFFASLKPLLPLLELLAARFIITRLVSANFATSLGMALMNPSEALAGLMIRTQGLRAAIAGLGFGAAKVGVLEFAGAIGVLNTAMIALAVAFAAFKAGNWIHEKITGDKANLAAAEADNAQTDNAAGQIGGFKKRLGGLHSEKDRAGLLGEINDAGKQFAGNSVLSGFFNRLAEQAKKAALAPAAPASFEAIAGKTPVGSLARVGGGLAGIGVGGGDPVLSEARRHTKILERIANAVSPDNGRQAVPIPS